MDQGFGIQKIAKPRPILLVDIIERARFPHRPVPKGSHALHQRRHPGFDVFELINSLDDGGEGGVRLVNRCPLLRRVREVRFRTSFVVLHETSVRGDAGVIGSRTGSLGIGTLPHQGDGTSFARVGGRGHN
jgi:hypothetical protein